MRLVSKYLGKIGGIIAAVLLLAVSSGFTVVLHSCLMETMQCCETMSTDGSMDAAMPTQGSRVAQAGSSCCTSTVIGGLNSFTALLEKQTKTDHLKVAIVLLHTDPSDQFSLLTSPVRHFVHSAHGASPPSVEKYILHAALLI